MRSWTVGALVFPLLLVLASGSAVAADPGAPGRLWLGIDGVAGGLFVSTDSGATFVRAATGYAIGGIPPLGHATAMETLIDPDLLQYDTVWAAAGTPHAVFPVDPHELVRATGGRVLPVAAAQP